MEGGKSFFILTVYIAISFGILVLVIIFYFVAMMLWPNKFKSLSVPSLFKVETHAPIPPPDVNNNSSVNQNVTTYNQQGGQTAHTIINHETPDRHLADVRERLVRELRQLPPQEFKIMTNPGAEIAALTKELDAALRAAGWTGESGLIDLVGGQPAGINIVVKEPNPSVIALAQVLVDGKFKVGTYKEDWPTRVEIRIGSKS